MVRWFGVPRVYFYAFRLRVNNVWQQAFELRTLAGIYAYCHT